MKGVLMHPPTPIHSGFCSISSRPEGPGYHRRMHSVETVGVDEFLSSVSKLIIEQQVLQREKVARMYAHLAGQNKGRGIIQHHRLDLFWDDMMM